MSPLLLKLIIVCLPFGFSLMWFVYWVVKLYKEKQRLALKKKSQGAENPR